MKISQVAHFSSQHFATFIQFHVIVDAASTLRNQTAIKKTTVVKPGPYAITPAKVKGLNFNAFKPINCPIAASRLSPPIPISIQKMLRSSLPLVKTGARQKHANPKKNPQARNSIASVQMASHRAGTIANHSGYRRPNFASQPSSRYID